MNGNGLYPSDSPRHIRILSSVASTPMQWDIFIRNYVLPRLNDSPLIQNNHQTCNYRREGNAIKCESCHNWAWDIHFNQDVSDKAVVVHGCKDGSLINAIINLTENNDFERESKFIPSLSEGLWPDSRMVEVYTGTDAPNDRYIPEYFHEVIKETHEDATNLQQEGNADTTPEPVNKPRRTRGRSMKKRKKKKPVQNPRTPEELEKYRVALRKAHAERKGLIEVEAE